MSTVLLSQNDKRLRDAVAEELAWDRAVDASAIGVSAADNAITLTGYISSYAGKLMAERAAKRVRGVRAVANEIQVRLVLDHPDEEIARDAAHALKRRTALPDRVQAVVHHGHVTLTGRVDSLFDRAVAERAMRDIRGIKQIINRIEVAPNATPRDIEREIRRALHRHATIDARHVSVDIESGRAVLHGTVSSMAEREAAEDAASQALGVIAVDNRLSVRADVADLALDDDDRALN